MNRKQTCVILVIFAMLMLSNFVEARPNNDKEKDASGVGIRVRMRIWNETEDEFKLKISGEQEVNLTFLNSTISSLNLTDVREVELEDGLIRIDASQNGIRVEVIVNATTGEQIRIEQKEDETEEVNRTAGFGGLISEAEEVRKGQFKITKEELKELGYHGRVDQFAVSFSKYVNQLKAAIRGKINMTITIANGNLTINTSSSNINWTSSLVEEVAERELARIREEKISSLNISDENLTDEIRGILNYTSVANLSILRAEFREMRKDFKNMIFEIARNGTKEEKKELVGQLISYMNRLQEHSRIRLLERARDRSRLIRELLNRNESLTDIIMEIEK